MKKSLVPAVALSGALALGLAGCGSAASTTSGASSSSRSSAPAAAAGQSTNVTDLTTKISDAMVKTKTGKGTISIAGGSTPTSGTGTMQFAINGATTEAQGNFTISGLVLEIITKDGLTYIKGFPTQTSGGKPWIKIDPKGTDELSKSMAQLGNNTGDPRTLVNSLKGGKATVKSTSGGLTTYDITGATALAGGTLEVTIDDQGLPSVFKVTTAGVTATSTYSDWGAPVTITAPPADQVGVPAAPTATG